MSYQEHTTLMTVANRLAIGDLTARFNRALVLRRADRLAEAADELRRTIEDEPRAEAYYQLGIVYWHQGDLDRAAKALAALDELQAAFRNRTVPIDEEIMTEWAQLLGAKDKNQRDMALAATATVRGSTPSASAVASRIASASR